MARRGGVSLREAALWTVLSLASVVAGEEGCAAPTDSPTHDDRELREYERQMQQHAASESEWEAIEREEIKGEFIRSVLRNVAALLAMGFVLWLVYSRLKQLRNAQLGRSAAKLGTGYRAPDKAEVMKSASTQKGDSFVTTPQKPNGEILRKSDGSPFPSGPIKTQEELLKAAAASRALYEKTIATPPGSSSNLAAMDAETSNK